MRYFGVDTAYELDDAQLQFAQWIRFYKLLNELPLADRPESEVIENDEKCDRWWEGYTRQVEHEAHQFAREMSRRRNIGAGFEVPTFHV